MSASITRPGKIIAVHLSYASRADQRGRRPATPSYFFKPASSVAATGGTVERPAGTELLAFEGEIALVIGTAARRVPIADAWAHVGWVTASNDLGLYDLRANDKGSNVRSKGGDGYTPLGPDLIDASAVDPSALRVRSWVNGELRQDDTTAGLIFPLAQIVADLSQHFTLEPGDVILTGTPAGSSVILPGDVVEIEVDAPDAAGSPSSGRLSTTVVQGDLPFDPELGSLPAVDDLQRTEAWGSAEAAGLAAGPSTGSGTQEASSGTQEASSGTQEASSGTQEGSSGTQEGSSGTQEASSGTQEESSGPSTGSGTQVAGLSPELRAKLKEAPTAGLSAQLRKRGHHSCFIDGVAANIPGSKIVGTAKTLRFVPFREDLFASHGGYNAQKRVFDAVADGEVIVIEARGDRTTGTLGDILALRARSRGAAGVVTDGGVRDFDAVADIGLAVFSQGAHPSVLGRRHVPWESDTTISCGGATVQPGDIIVGDGDGVIVIPPALAEEVADATLAQEREDDWIATQVEAGHAVDGLFPMNAEWRARYDDETGGR